MTALWAVARRELSSLFRVPLGWVALAAFALVSSWLFLRGVLVPGQPATMRPIFSTMGWLLLPLAPAVSMRLVSEELRSGTIEPLMTSPASDYAVILGKFLGAFLFLGILLSPTLLHAWLLWSHAAPAPDVGPLAAGYLSVALLAALFLAVGLFISTLTSNQTLAFLGALMAILAMMVGPELLSSTLAGSDAAWAPRVAGFVRGLEIGRRLEDFARGVIDTGHVAAFAAWAGVFLVAAAVSLESRRWRSARPILRGLRFGGLSLVLLSAVLLSAVLGTLLADKYARRFDVTSTGEHRLAPRTAALVEGLTGRAEVIVAADWLTLDRRVREDVRDVLDRFARASPNVGARPIDFSAAAGRAEYGALLKDMTAREADKIAAARAAVEAAVKQSAAIRADLSANVAPGVEDALRSVPDPGGSLAPVIARVQQAAAGVASAARALSSAEERAVTLLSRQVEGVAVPATDEAASGLRGALDLAARQLVSLDSELRDLGAAQPRAAAGLRAAADGVRSRRENADAAGEPLRSLPTINVLTVVSATAQNASLIVRASAGSGGGGGGVSVRAVPLERITRSADSGSSADLRRRLESEIAAGLAAITNDRPPIVVFMSADPVIASGVRLYEEATQRLRRAGGDVLAWDLIDQAEPPSLTRLNPDGKRPVVYVVRMPDQSQPAFGQIASGIARGRQLAEAAQALSDKGAAVLIGVAPAVVPGSKEPEAADRLLAPFGLTSRSDRPIVTELRSPAGVSVDLNARARSQGDGPLAAAVSRDPVLLPWATPLTTARGATAALVVEAQNAWREGRWLELRRGGPDGRPARMPAYDAAEDDRVGPWTVVASAELPAAAGTPARRLVAVGSAEWLDDGLLTRRVSVDGRSSSPASGNLELLDAAVAWLSGQESLALPSASAGAVAIVAPIGDSARDRLWWLLVAGLPLGVLVLGGAYRLVRG